jgi:hypothetical protein
LITRLGVDPTNQPGHSVVGLVSFIRIGAHRPVRVNHVRNMALVLTMGARNAQIGREFNCSGDSIGLGIPCDLGGQRALRRAVEPCQTQQPHQEDRLVTRIGRPIAVVIGLVAAIVPATSVFAAPATTSKVLYKSLIASPGNVVSESFEATETAQFGNEISLTRSARVASVVVTMSSWGCQSGSWTDDTCVTAAGSKFTEPITLNIFAAPADPNANNGAPGALLLSVTKTFSIPYRPSANNRKCVGAELGAWFDTKLGECFNGLATNITFSLSSLHVTLPKTFVFGIAYNTSDYGATPYGDATACHSTSEGCGYDSLNVGLSEDPDNLARGTDPNPGTIWQNTSYAPYYCDGGTAGTDSFRFDSPNTAPCWGVDTASEAPWYIPAVQFTAV